MPIARVKMLLTNPKLAWMFENCFPNTIDTTVHYRIGADDREIAECLRTLIATDAGTGFMHESFHKDDPANFTRPWFAWANTLFGELVLKLVNEGKTPLLNSL